ncbi:MAG: hypothetical protein IT529_08335 [Burkholderiales bacterium]|nr:hypothetical protein [Burkholderiales bacterium]
MFLRALRRGGIAVFQSTGFSRSGPRPSLPDVIENWKGFHVLRIEDVDAGAISDEWGPSRTNRTWRMVVRKD